jgi:pimeloyl-ACP methyl ester carboxylesterase
MIRARAPLSEFVRALPALVGGDPERLYVMGVSQGAIMSMEMALLGERVAGVVALSGRTPLALVERDAATPCTLPPIFMAHGTEDPIIPIDRARETRAKLGDCQVDLTYQVSDVVHCLGLERMDQPHQSRDARERSCIDGSESRHVAGRDDGSAKYPEQQRRAGEMYGDVEYAVANYLSWLACRTVARDAERPIERVIRGECEVRDWTPAHRGVRRRPQRPLDRPQAIDAAVRDDGRDVVEEEGSPQGGRECRDRQDHRRGRHKGTSIHARI